ncbi:hypothetical protein FH972_017914 [Carpinus fangiana]|uniref:Cellulose synthase RING-type zinc finger domain-containing protein n=1 Tax=Carpinus fangiana TaxID=176857 RepID=A0A5N6RMF9_9ROSI|nr:hypothetical protein FH972_017914 [Carpinus fangiana]
MGNFRHPYIQIASQLNHFCNPNKAIRFFLSFSVLSITFSFLSFLIHSFHVHISTFPMKLFSYTVDKDYTFLLCNGLLVFIVKNSGLVGKSSLGDDLTEEHVMKRWPLQQLSGQICQICGDDVGLTMDRELFVACNKCAFPVCRTCYEYERREGNQVCPQCKTRFKRLKGCARVQGDEEEDDIDDLDNEFNFDARTKQDMHHALAADAMLHYGRASDSDLPHVLHSTPQVPLLTNGQMVDDIPPEQHALVPSFMGGAGGGKRIHPLPLSDPTLPAQQCC